MDYTKVVTRDLTLVRHLTGCYLWALPPKGSPSRLGPALFYLAVFVSTSAVFVFLSPHSETTNALVRSAPFVVLGVVTYVLERRTEPGVPRLREAAQQLDEHARDLLRLSVWLERDWAWCRTLHINGDWATTALLFGSFILGLPEGLVHWLMVFLAVWASVRLYLSLRCAHNALALDMLRYSKLPR